MLTEIIFDIETKKLFNEIATEDPGDLGISVVSAYRRELNESMEEVSGEMHSFWERDFTSLWQLLRDANRIIGFNSLKFDVPALAVLAPYDIARLPHFDIMAKVREVVGRNIGLDHLVRQTLGKGKNDSGANAVTYWKNGDPDSLKKLRTYCEMDVMITRDLYDYGLKHGMLKYLDQWNNPKDIPVDFSYPREVIEKSRQIGLF